jgi:hypothetical protein
VKRSSELRSSEKKSFDQTPNLTETFDQVKRSSEIRSSECFPMLDLYFIFISIFVFPDAGILLSCHHHSSIWTLPSKLKKYRF